MKAAGPGAALLWVLLCVRWFDAGAPYRPAWLAAVPPAALAIPALLLALPAFRAVARALSSGPDGGPRGGLLLAVGLAVLFRLPLAWQGAAGYLTPDGALSGIVALHIRDAADHLVFVPTVPYSGSLKSHVAAPLSSVLDPARAFALASVFFYAVFVAAVYRLAALAAPEGLGKESTAVPAGIYAAFAPAYVTHYSLSNDGNYVEVLALGAWALVAAVRWIEEPARGPTLALAAGLFLGVAFWCHILAVIHAAAVGLALLIAGPHRVPRSLPGLLGGFTLGYVPGLLWNAGNGWESFRYLIPGGASATEAWAGLAARVMGMISDQWPILLGYDPGYPRTLDAPLHVLAFCAVAVAVFATASALKPSALRRPALLVLVVFTGMNLALALLALSYIPGNPRYILFLMTCLPVFLARALGRGRRRLVMVLLVAFGALGSLGQAAGTIRSDAQWRSFVSSLESEGVRFCYTDFHTAAKINFLSEEVIVCSAKLGPVTKEYFLEYLARVESAPAAALIAVNKTAAEKLQRRLDRLGVAYERRDFMKPVLLRLSRKVDPVELFPEGGALR